MSRPTAHGLACASYGNEPSLCPVHADGEQLPHDVSMSARLLFATQSAAGHVVTRATHSQKPLPCAHESPNPEIASPFLHDDSKLEMPATLYLLEPISSI